MSKLYNSSNYYIYPCQFEKMLPELRRHIQSIIFNPDRVEDILQDTIVTALCKASAFKPPYKLLSWLKTIARNKSINFLRRENRFISLDNHPQLIYQLDPVEPFTMDSVQTAGVPEDVKFCINTLKPAMQDILRLKYFSKLSIKQIGQILNIPEGTIKRRLFAARNRLRKELLMSKNAENFIYPEIRIENGPFRKIIREKSGYGVCFGAPCLGIGDMEVCDMYEYPGPVLSYRVRSTVMRAGTVFNKRVLEVRNDYEKTSTMENRLMYFSLNDSSIEMVFRVFNEIPELRVDFDPHELIPKESLILDTEHPGDSLLDMVHLHIGLIQYPNTIREIKVYDDFHGRGYSEQYWAENGRAVLQRNYIGENWHMGGFVSYTKLELCPQITYQGEVFRLMNEFILVDHS